MTRFNRVFVRYCVKRFPVSYTHLDVYKRQYQSTTGHEESGGKQEGPPSKAKYDPVTDSA